MYINFHKHNYNALDPAEVARYEERDKHAYKEVLKDWFNSNLDIFVERKWEVEEIHYLKEISDFIKLIREAESIYELGFFTSCVALIGVASEDFSKYLSIKNNKPDHITDVYSTGRRRGQTYDVSQFTRLKLQLDENLIDENTYLLMDEIRSIRNDCLHYNQNFKQKITADIKIEAIRSLNNLKTVLKNTIGTLIDVEDFKDLFEELFENENSRNFEEIAWKQKNMLSHLLPFSTVQDPSVKKVVRSNLYVVSELDDEEITLSELIKNEKLGTNLFVWVDLDKAALDLIKENGIKQGDTVFAVIYSNIAIDGQTRGWFVNKIHKISS